MDQQGCKLQRITDHLVQNSLLKGSMDNVTCVLVRVSNYVSRTQKESLPSHLSQQSEVGNMPSASRNGYNRNTPMSKYTAGDDDEDFTGGLDGVSVYYPPGGIGSAVSNSTNAINGVSRNYSSAREEETEKKQSASKALSRSKSTNRLAKGSSKRVPIDPYGNEGDSSNNVQDSSHYGRRGQKQQSSSAAMAGSDGVESNGHSRISKDASHQGQLPFPSSAYRSLHRPYTQASASGSNSSHLEAVGRTPSTQKALFVPSAYGSQMAQSGSADVSGNDSTGYNGGRSYALFGGNSMVPVRDHSAAYNRPSTSNAEMYGNGRGYASKRYDSYSNSRFVSDSTNRPISAASTLNQRIQGSGPPANLLNGSRHGGSSSSHEHGREFSSPHSPINTRGRR